MPRVPSTNSAKSNDAIASLANLPFSDTDWHGKLLKDDKRWAYGTPPAGNVNYARVALCN